MAGGKIKKVKAKRPSAVPYRSGISFHKSKGQHILIDSSIIDQIVQKSGIKSTDVILEIGPGTGNLTDKLLRAGKSVIAVELDHRMVFELQRRFQGSPYSYRLKVIQGDVLKTKLPYFDICVSNIPYEISGRLIEKLLNHQPGFRCAIIMLQREVAMRLQAQPGESFYSRLSANTQLSTRVSHLLKVGKECFCPPPKVDSSVVRIEPKKPAPDPNLVRQFDGLMRVCFNRKNKTLGSIFRKKKVRSMIETNYKTLQALQQSGGSVVSSVIKNLDFGDEEEDEDEDDDDDLEEEEEMEVDNGGKDKMEFKEKILNVLKEGGFGKKRSSDLSQQEFLYLLSLFNKAGIYFSGLSTGALFS